MKKALLIAISVLTLNGVVMGQETRKSENVWIHATAFSWSVLWPITEGYIHGLMFTNEQPVGYPLGINIGQDNKHALYMAHRSAMLGGAISLALWHPPVKYFFTARGASRTVGAWCVWTSMFNATVRKVQTDHYFPENNQIHGYDLDLIGVHMRFKEPPVWMRKAQLVTGITLYFLPDIIDLVKGKNKKSAPAPDLLAQKSFFVMNFSPNVNLTKGEKFYGGEIIMFF